MSEGNHTNKSSHHGAGQKDLGKQGPLSHQQDHGNDEHPSMNITGSHGTQLTARRIVLCVSGSVAAYKAIELARLLMRYGGSVKCVMSGAAAQIIRPDYFQWATGNKVITRLTGDLEHVQLADYDKADLIIAYPATANTLGKMANGIDDTAVATVLATGLGSNTPILACPAMHQAMYKSPAVARNVQFLRGRIKFLEPLMSEGKARAAEPEEVLEYVLGMYATESSALRSKKVLMTAGPTIEPIDPIRSVTNTSTGRTGVLLASELVSAGAEVTIIYGPGEVAPPVGAKIITVRTGRQMLAAVRGELQKKFDVIIMAAAAPDYIPEKISKTKIKSNKESLTVKLKRAPKIIDQIRRLQRDTLLVGFKAEANVSINTLVRSARRKLKESDADMIIANDIGTEYQKDTDKNQVFVVDRNTKASSASLPSSGRTSKQEIARFITKEIQKRINP